MAQMAHIRTVVPPRKAGQRDVVGLTAAPMETVRIGIVGLGIRGQQALKRLQLATADCCARSHVGL